MSDENLDEAMAGPGMQHGAPAAYQPPAPHPQPAQCNAVTVVSNFEQSFQTCPTKEALGKWLQLSGAHRIIQTKKDVDKLDSEVAEMYEQLFHLRKEQLEYTLALARVEARIAALRQDPRVPRYYTLYCILQRDDVSQFMQTTRCWKIEKKFREMHAQHNALLEAARR